MQVYGDDTTQTQSVNMRSEYSRQVSMSMQQDDESQPQNNQSGQGGYSNTSLEQEIQKLIKSCMTYMPMMENFTASQSQSGSPDFATGEVDVVILQVHIDNCFLGCESILNTRAGYNLAAQSMSGNNMSQQN